VNIFKRKKKLFSWRKKESIFKRAKKKVIRWYKTLRKSKAARLIAYCSGLMIIAVLEDLVSDLEEKTKKDS